MPEEITNELESGALDLDVRKIGSQWSRPQVEVLDAEWLTWRQTGADQVLRDPPGKFLLSFAALADESVDFAVAVSQFANRWGVLGLCGHGLPDTHRFARLGPRSDRVSPTFDKLSQECETWRLSDGRRAEPIEGWLVYARQVDALLRSTSLIVQEKKVPAAIWDNLDFLVPPAFRPVAERRRGRLMRPEELRGKTGIIGDITVKVFPDDRAVVAFAVRRLLDLADIRPVFTLGRSSAQGFGATTMFGALVLRVASAVANRTGQKVCKYCNIVYPPIPRERQTKNCCEGDECIRKRWIENAQRRKAGEQNKRGTYAKRKK